MDKEGYKAVAYARATAVIGEALKELKRETDEKLNSILQELSTLREDIQALRSQSLVSA